MKNLETIKNELQSKAQKEAEKMAFDIQVLTEISKLIPGFDLGKFSIIHGFKPFISVNNCSFLDVAELLKVADDEPQIIRFSSKPDLITCSNFTICTDSHINSGPEFKNITIKCSFVLPLGRFDVWAHLPYKIESNRPKLKTDVKQGKHLGFGRYESLFSLQPLLSGVSVVNWSGGGRTYYASSIEEAETLRRYIL